MEEADLYSGVAEPQFYRLFHELVSSPTVREYFSWNHDNFKFEDTEKARLFFDLIQPIDGAPSKLRTFSDVRSWPR